MFEIFALLAMQSSVTFPDVDKRALASLTIKDTNAHIVASYKVCSWIEAHEDRAKAFKTYTSENGIDAATSAHLVHDCSLAWEVKSWEEFRRIPMPKPKPRP